MRKAELDDVGERFRSTALAAAVLLLLATVMASWLLVPAQASVGLEYLGPYPLEPKPIDGQPHLLADSGTTGNTGTEQALFTLSLAADSEFEKYFTVTFSDNNFTLNPGERRHFTVTFQFDPNTPIRDWSASVSIVANAIGGGGGAVGVASFNVPLHISQTAIPEFPHGFALLALMATLSATFLALKSRYKKSLEFHLPS
jgi:hypothetical protein